MAEPIVLYLSILLVLLLVLQVWTKRKTSSTTGRPLPGPPLLEGIGIFIKGTLNNTLHLYLPEWAKKYGNIIEVNLLTRRAIFINDSGTYRRLVKDSESREWTNDRPSTFIGTHYYNVDKNIIFAQAGYELQQKRKIFHGGLKFYGEGRGQIEKVMVALLQEMVQNFKSKDVVELSRSFKNLVTQILCCLYTGSASEITKERLHAIADFATCFDNTFVFEVETVLQPFPFLRFIPGLKYNRLNKAIMNATRNLRMTIFEPMKTAFFSSQSKDCLVGYFLTKQREFRKKGHKFQLDDETIRTMLHDFTAGGYLTTSATLSTLFLELIIHQDIQDRIYEEIVSVIGDSTPSFQHSSQMSFTKAAILETLRISSVVPLCLPHAIREDFVFDGYHFPKLATLSMNAWYNHHREDYWEEPFTFKPERYLDAKGDVVGVEHPARKRLIPFGTGPRLCPGETFGKARAFLVTVFLIKNFQFLRDEEVGLPSADPKDWSGNLVLSPANIRCKIIPRQVS